MNRYQLAEYTMTPLLTGLFLGASAIGTAVALKHDPGAAAAFNEGMEHMRNFVQTNGVSDVADVVQTLYHGARAIADGARASDLTPAYAALNTLFGSLGAITGNQTAGVMFDRPQYS